MMDRAKTLLVSGAGRPKNAEDAARLIRQFRGSPDRGYLEPRLQEIAEALDRPEILGTFRREMGP